MGESEHAPTQSEAHRGTAVCSLTPSPWEVGATQDQSDKLQVQPLSTTLIRATLNLPTERCRKVPRELSRRTVAPRVAASGKALCPRRCPTPPAPLEVDQLRAEAASSQLCPSPGQMELWGCREPRAWEASAAATSTPNDTGSGGQTSRRLLINEPSSETGTWYRPAAHTCGLQGSGGHGKTAPDGLLQRERTVKQGD